jgi:Ca-dependent carbohydrate-binding module xylan-binding
LLNDLYAGTPATDRNLYLDAISYNGTSAGQGAAIVGFVANNFAVVDTTAIPGTAILPPPVSIGSGLDTLVLNMSEDAYKGDAQFTVSVDGMQLGGTFATAALHAAGQSQSFAFKGDFGPGQHTVAVNFRNDAYGGMPLADRNLYVNGANYNGTATGQTLTLLGGGSKTFTVSGGTTPSVSEISDHGTLQANLSQVGTYDVGGDTFIIGSGNVVSVTLGSGGSQLSFIGAHAITLTGGSGTSSVTSDTGNNSFTTGTGGLDVTGGGGANAYVFHAGAGFLTIEDFSLAKGDTLMVDQALQGSLVKIPDGKDGTILNFGTVGQGVDIRGIATMQSSDILWS